MRCKFIIIFGILPAIIFAQNPLKKALVGNSQSVHYSQSQFTFTNQAASTVFVTELTDNRALNWNKQVNDSVKIEAIGDFWNYDLKALFKNKINQDFSKANVKVEPVTLAENMIKIEPTIDVLYPNFVNFPKKGYWVLAKINMKVSKNSQTLFTKSYQEYTLFSRETLDYKESFNTDLKDGANVAMWSSMKRLLDKFYSDLNIVMAGGNVESVNTALSSIQRTSNIDNDPNLVNKQTAYSGVKDRSNTNEVNNYRMETPADLPPPSDGNLENAINALGTKAKDEPKKIVKAPVVTPPAPRSVITDSAKIALKKLRDDLRKKAIDSTMKIKEQMAASAKLKEDAEKVKLKELAELDKLKKDSILKANKLASSLKLKEKAIADSLKKAEINQKIELAKKKREAEKARIQAAVKPVVEKVKDTTAITKVIKPIKLPKKEPEITAPKVAAVKPKIEKSTPVAIVNTPEPNSMAFKAPEKRVSPKTGNEDIGEEVKRIAREIEMEENKSGSKYKVSAEPKKSIEPKAVEPKSTNPSPAISRKSQRDSFVARMKEEKSKRELEETAKKKSEIVSLMQARKAKQEAIENAIARAKAVKDSLKSVVVVKPVDPKKYALDSIKLALDKQRKREAILAAQKAAREAEVEALTKNPNAGELFAMPSSDPPSKLPDNRTREQILADRIFTPKNDVSKDLLARVKLITPEEEAKLMNQLKTSELSNVDSFFIEQQKNRPIPTFKPIDTTVSIKPSIDTVKSIKELAKGDKKAAIVAKSLKATKAEKDSIAKVMKASAINSLKDSITKKKEAIANKSIKTVEPVIEKKATEIIPSTPTKTDVKIPTKTDVKVPVKTEVKSTTVTTPVKTATPAPPTTATDKPKTDEEKIKDLEGDIDKKAQELKDKIKKAKSW